MSIKEKSIDPPDLYKSCLDTPSLHNVREYMHTQSLIIQGKQYKNYGYYLNPETYVKAVKFCMHSLDLIHSDSDYNYIFWNGNV